MQRLIDFSLDYDIKLPVPQNASNHHIETEVDDRCSAKEASLSARRRSDNDILTALAKNRNRSFRTPCQRKLESYFKNTGPGSEPRYLNLCNSANNKAYKTYQSTKAHKNDEQMITNKLAYEWKNIFRTLTQKGESKEITDLKTFDEAC